MRTRSQSRNSNRQQQQVPPTFVEPFDLEEPINNQDPPDPPVVTMADNRTMAQLLEAPTEGYEDAIVVPEITADNFELKHGLLTLVQNKQFFGHDKEDPHAHIRYFNKITSTMKFPNVPRELTLRVGKEAVTFNIDQTSRYSSNYDDNSFNRIDVIDMAYEEYSQEVLGFSDVVDCYLLEEVDISSLLEDDPTSPKVDHSYTTEGDNLL
ncbi:hypothetical protein Tco_1051877 [Tanacetum coccineum]